MMSCGTATVSSPDASSCRAASVAASSIKSATSASAARTCSGLADSGSTSSSAISRASVANSTSSSAISASVANSSSCCTRTGPELDAGARLDCARLNGQLPSFGSSTFTSPAADLWVSLPALDGGPGGSEERRIPRVVEEASEPSVVPVLFCTFCAWCWWICRSTCALSRRMRRLARSCKTRWCRRHTAPVIKQHESSSTQRGSMQYQCRLSDCWTWTLAQHLLSQSWKSTSSSRVRVSSGQ